MSTIDLPHSCHTLANLELYPLMNQKELKIIKPTFKLQMKVPVKRNGLQDYNIYSIVICMFILEFLNSLP